MVLPPTFSPAEQLPAGFWCWGTLGHMRWGRRGEKGKEEGKRRERRREKERKLEAFGALSVIFMYYSHTSDSDS